MKKRHQPTHQDIISATKKYIDDGGKIQKITKWVDVDRIHTSVMKKIYTQESIDTNNLVVDKTIYATIDDDKIK